VQDYGRQDTGELEQDFPCSQLALDASFRASVVRFWETGQIERVL
jgi:hypothetical protein